MIISVVLVSLVRRPEAEGGEGTREPARTA
jgi:hypothetical protein